MDASSYISPELKSFRTFFKKIGFKRIEGSIYGHLVLSKDALSAEAIEKSLGLSQGSVSSGLKTLASYKAIHSFDNPNGRGQLHEAEIDCLQIVANVFRKREQDFIFDYKSMVQGVLDQTNLSDITQEQKIKRLRSIVTTCDLAQAVMDFVITLSRLGGTQGQYDRIVQKLPTAFNMLTQSTEIAHDLSKKIKLNFSHKINKYVGRARGEIHD